jgi:phage-related protein
MPKPRPLVVQFFKTDTGNEPVRKWLRGLPSEEKAIIGADIKIVQWKWPMGLPLVDSFGHGLWEVRSTLAHRIARVFFILVDEEIILLHGIIKKSQTAPSQDVSLARKRQSEYVQLTGQLNENKGTIKKGEKKRKSPPGK